MNEPKTTQAPNWKDYRERYANAPVVIAGERYDLLYRLQEKREIEQKLGKNLFKAMFSGNTDDFATILWIGIKHRAKKKLGSPEAVVRLLDEHLELDPDTSLKPLFQAVVRSIYASRLFGGPDEINLAEVERLIGAGDEENAEGKAAPTS